VRFDVCDQWRELFAIPQPRENDEALSGKLSRDRCADVVAGSDYCRGRVSRLHDGLAPPVDSLDYERHQYQ
jgi:hypothetical protein